VSKIGKRDKAARLQTRDSRTNRHSTPIVNHRIEADTARVECGSRWAFADHYKISSSGLNGHCLPHEPAALKAGTRIISELRPLTMRNLIIVMVPNWRKTPPKFISTQKGNKRSNYNSLICHY
jgi:hypothetical protein